MSEEELLKFREELLLNPTLLKEFELHKLIDTTLENHDDFRFRRKISEIFHYKIAPGRLTDVSSEAGRPRRRIYSYVYVLPAFLILTLTVFFSFRGMKNDPDRIYSKFYRVYSQDITSRSSQSTEADSLSMGVYLYRSGEYFRSATTLSGIIGQDSSNYTAHFYRGLAEMAASDHRDAALDFRFVLNQEFNYCQEHCQWYLGLCYLKLGELAQARESFNQLNIRNSVYAVPSARILELLPETE